MIYARNQIVIPSSPAGIYKNDFTFTMPEDEPASKLTLRVYDNPIFVEVTEVFPPVFTGDIDAEMETGPGFDSLVFVTAITGFRFRAKTATSRVTFRAYG